MEFDGPLLARRWRLGPRLGRGGQAHTFLAKDTDGEHGVVVVKQLHLGKDGSTWKSYDLFEREVRVLRTLRHPAIPRLLDSFETEAGVFNLVMEKKPGATLRAFAMRVRFSDLELRDVLARVLEILDYLHRQRPPVIHRDIKPANLVRAADGTVALVDFGGVRDVLRTDGGSTVIGTFGYMAPEQLHGQATPATDLYSLGATIVALAAGVEPEEVPRRGLRMDLQRHLPSMHPPLRQVLEAMTHPDPEERPQSARAVLELLAKEPARKPPRQLGKPSSHPEVPRAFDEIGAMLGQIPPPLAVVLRILFLTVAVVGYAGLGLVRAVLLPLVFGAIGALSGETDKPKVLRAKQDVAGALDEGLQGFRGLTVRCLPGRDTPPELPRSKR